MNEIDKLKELVKKSSRIVFFGGAGVSTESGIPDYRSKDGLYNQKFANPPEVMLSRSYFFRDTEGFYDFYKQKMIWLAAKPNPAHIALAKLEKEGRLTGVITQNIDGLHQEAGSKVVLELHGTVHRNYCLKCHALYDAAFIQDSEGVPHCKCGGLVKPDVVLYEEPLNEQVMAHAVRLIAEADMLIIGGTSLAVYPAAGLINYYQGDRLVLVNRSQPPAARHADLFVPGRIGEIFGQL